MKALAGRRALITGAAGGIGRALAERLVAAGCGVVIADLDEEAAEAAVEEVRSAGGDALAMAMDVTDPESVRRARKRILARHGAPDLLVNNAGTVHGGAFGEVPLERHLDTCRINLLGAVVVTHAFWADLLERPAAHVVNLASASGFVGLPFGSTYAGSKWGLIGFSESLRRELEVTGHDHVGVTTVCPGYVRTGLFAGARPPRTTRMLEPEELAERVVDGILRNRPFVLTPWLVRLAPVLRGSLPTRLFDRVADLLGVSRSMEGWEGRREDEQRR